GLLELRERLVLRSALLQHRRVSRDCEQVLRESVVNLARNTRALVRDGAAEFGVADRAPDAYEKKPIRQHAQKVTARDGRWRQDRSEHVMQRREQHERRPEREPAVEILAPFVEALAEAHECEQVQECKRRE